MADFKVRIYKGSNTEPETTVTIPGAILRIASRLMPHRAASALEEKGVDLEELVKLSDNPQAHGVLVEVEEHKKNERVVISLE